MQNIQLNFNDNAVLAVNVILAILIFGISLSIKPSDFKQLLVKPLAPLIGMASQFILMPAFTFLLTFFLKIDASISLGLIVIASCPGGNLSNVMTHLAKGNSALSIGMTTISTFLALIFTPLNISLWGAMRPETSTLLHSVNLDPMILFKVIALVLFLPMLAGMLAAYKFPDFARLMEKKVKQAAFLFFLFAMIGAFATNRNQFIQYAAAVFIYIVLQNIISFACGYFLAGLTRLNERDRRAVAIETGIQNAGIAIVLVFTFFESNGAMLLVAAGVGAWQIASGTSLAFFWSKHQPEGTR